LIEEEQMKTKFTPMDPQIVLNEMLQAVIGGDADTASDRLFDIAAWVEKGGECPSIEPLIAKIVENTKRWREGPARPACHVIDFAEAKRGRECH
jgi:hypothetical protein